MTTSHNKVCLGYDLNKIIYMTNSSSSQAGADKIIKENKIDKKWLIISAIAAIIAAITGIVSMIIQLKK